MFINTNSIVINGVNMGPYITEAKYGYHKLWGSDSGRNLAGVQSGTLIGVFPKITLQFRKLKKSELEMLVPMFDDAIQNVVYYDPRKKTNITLETYTGDYEIVNRYLVNEESKNQPFSISFIARKKRV